MSGWWLMRNILGKTHAMFSNRTFMLQVIENLLD